MATVVNVENYPSIEDKTRIADIYGGSKELKNTTTSLLVVEKDEGLSDSASLTTEISIKDRKNSTDSGNESDDQNHSKASSDDYIAEEKANKYLLSGLNPYKCQLNQFRFSILWTISATAVCVCLLYVNSSSSKVNETNQNPIAPYIVKYENIHIDPRYGNFVKSTYSSDNSIWKKLENLAKLKKSVHFRVGTTAAEEFTDIRPIIEVKETSVQISGRPLFCSSKNNNDNNGIPKGLNFMNVTHLHISETTDCDNYIHLILNHWQFPQVKSLRFHKVIIRESEFESLVKFIDKYGQTLHRVEIDECYLCNSAACDAGNINFPEHDFQLAITRRRQNILLL